jgi:hypothetical protein
MGRYGLDSFGIGYRPMVGSCEHDNEPLSSRKCWELLLVAEQLLAPQEGLKSMALVI